MSTVEFKQYRKKPELIEAVKLTRENLFELVGWTNGRAVVETRGGNPPELVFGLDLYTKSGPLRVNEGDYVVKGGVSHTYDFFPMTEAAFQAEYEAAAPAEEPTPEPEEVLPEQSEEPTPEDNPAESSE